VSSGGLADIELFAYLHVREAARDEAEDLSLPLAELVDLFPRNGPRDADKLLYHPLRDSGGEKRISAGHRAYGGDQLLGRVVLEDEAARPGPEGLVDLLIQIERGEDEHPCRAIRRQDASGRFEAVELGHADIHRDDGGMNTRSLVDRLETVACLGDDLDVVFAGQQHAEAGSNHRLVIRDKQADTMRLAEAWVQLHLTLGVLSRAVDTLAPTVLFMLGEGRRDRVVPAHDGSRRASGTGGSNPPIRLGKPKTARWDPVRVAGFLRL
jgi:hypothetical protein